MPVGPTQILLIDANPLDQEAVRRILSREKLFPFRMECAADLASALDRLNGDNGFELALIDLALPDSFGLDTFRKIHSQAPDIPAIILTGSDNGEEATKALREGAEDYLVKGDFSSDLLVRSVRHAVERHSARKAVQQSNESLRRANRALTVLSRSNGVLTRAKDELELLGEACRILVEIGGYALAWVGFAESGPDQTVRVVAKWGYGKGHLETVRISWADDEYGRGQAGTAIRTRTPYISRFIETDPRFEPWRATVIQLGYRSSASFPLTIEDSCFGVLCICSAEPDAFDDDEAKLLTELADDLSYGIMNVRSIAERKKIEQELRQSERFLTNVLQAYKTESVFWILNSI